MNTTTASRLAALTAARRDGTACVYCRADVGPLRTIRDHERSDALVACAPHCAPAFACPDWCRYADADGGHAWDGTGAEVVREHVEADPFRISPAATRRGECAGDVEVAVAQVEHIVGDGHYAGRVLVRLGDLWLAPREATEVAAALAVAAARIEAM